MSETPWWKPSIAEFVGVFALVYIGAGSIIVTNFMGWGGEGPERLVVIALAHGLAIGTMVTALGHLSGGHFNPAVTIAALFTKKINTDLGILYLVFQLLGGIFGAFMLVFSLPVDAWSAVSLGTPGVDTVRITAAQAVFIEAALTFFLVFVVFGAGVDPENKGGFKAAGGLAIGLTVCMDILMGGPLTGAAMNPARAFGPALVSRAWDNQLVYWVGPIVGGLLAGLLYDSLYFDQRPEGSEGAEEPDDAMQQPQEAAPPVEPPASSTGGHALEPEPDTTPGGHDPTSLDDPKGP